MNTGIDAQSTLAVAQSTNTGIDAQSTLANSEEEQEFDEAPPHLGDNEVADDDTTIVDPQAEQNDIDNGNLIELHAVD